MEDDLFVGNEDKPEKFQISKVSCFGPKVRFLVPVRFSFFHGNV